MNVKVQKSVATALVMALIIGIVGYMAVFVYADTQSNYYEVYTELRYQNNPVTAVDKYNGITVWFGGGNVKRDVNGSRLVTNYRAMQLYLYHNLATHDTYGTAVVSNDYSNITNAAGVLWAISESPDELTFDGNKIKKSESASVNKGKVVAREKLTNYDDSSQPYVKAYAIAYKMNKKSDGKVYKFGDIDGKTEGTGYSVLAAVKVEVKQAATAIDVFDNPHEVTAFQENSTNKAYSESPVSGKYGAAAVSGQFPNELKRTNSVKVGIDEITTLYVSATAGVNKDKTAKPITEDGSTYTLSIVPNKFGVRYITLIDESGYKVDSVVMDHNRLSYGFDVAGLAVVSKVGKNGNIKFSPSKSTVQITNNQSGKTARVAVTVTNSIVTATSLSNIQVTAPYNKKATYTFDLRKGVYADTTGGKPTQVLNTFKNVTRDASGEIKENDRAKSDPGGWTFDYQLGPKITPNATTHPVVNPDSPTGAPFDPEPELPVLVKPMAAVYVPNGSTGEANFINALKAEIAKSSATKPMLPKANSTALYQKAKGYRASVGKDNATITLTTPKIGFAEPGINDPANVYLVVIYGSGEANDVLIQKITVSPKNPDVMPVSVNSAPGFSIIEGKLTDASYTIPNVTVGESITISIDGIAPELTGKFTLMRTASTTVSGATVAAKAAGECAFKIKIGKFTYTISITAQAPTP